jgi:hypothetical protein
MIEHAGLRHQENDCRCSSVARAEIQRRIYCASIRRFFGIHPNEIHQSSSILNGSDTQLNTISFSKKDYCGGVPRSAQGDFTAQL